MENVSQKWVLEVFKNAEEEERGLFDQGETKEKDKRCVRGRKREKVGNREQREQCSPVSAFWTAACWMIGLKSLFNMTSVLYFDINTPYTPL